MYIPHSILYFHRYISSLDGRVLTYIPSDVMRVCLLALQCTLDKILYRTPKGCALVLRKSEINCFFGYTLGKLKADFKSILI